MPASMTITEVTPHQIPASLLLEADPSAASISTYLLDSWCLVATSSGQIIAACVVKPHDSSRAELFNIAVSPDFQGKGWGTQLLRHTIQYVRNKNMKRLELGTGTFGHQLTFYQRLGFRVYDVVQNHFLDNYDEPIWENGLQHKDMLRLYLNL